MISYDFNAHSLNGEAVPFCALPFHALESIFSHKELTHAAKNTYVALLAYAAYVKKLEFNITVGWVAEKISVTRKTASAALAQLREFGFASENGITIPDTTKRARKAEKPSTKNKASSVPEAKNQNNQLVDDTRSAHPFDLHAEQPAIVNDNSIDAQETQLSYEEEVEILVKTGFAREKAEKIINNSRKKLPISEEKITKSMDTFYSPNNNTENRTDKDNLTTSASSANSKPQFAAANQVGCQFSSSVEVGEVKDKPSNSNVLANIISKATKVISKQKSKQEKIVHDRAYTMGALIKMNVTSPSKREIYFLELMYALKMGFIRSLRAGLWLIGQGRWKTPIGFAEHHKAA